MLLLIIFSRLHSNKIGVRRVACWVSDKGISFFFAQINNVIGMDYDTRSILMNQSTYFKLMNLREKFLELIRRKVL